MKDRLKFTLVELLVVLAIVGLVAALLFPTFAENEERSRQRQCAANLKDFMAAIHMYADDNDDALPLAWNIMAQVGPKVSADSAGKLKPRGLYVELSPYVKDIRTLQCADDKGIEVDPNNSSASFATVPFRSSEGGRGTDPAAVHEPFGTPAYEIFGMSYKATKQNFTIVNDYGGERFKCTDKDDPCLGKATGKQPADPKKYTIPPPNPLRFSFFARPAETRVLRDFLSTPGETEDWAKPSTVWHTLGETVAFADGHTALVRDASEEGQFCDGPTSSPNYDGTCNIKGLERYR